MNEMDAGALEAFPRSKTSSSPPGPLPTRPSRAGALSARTVTTREIAARFPRQKRARIALTSLAYFVAFYGGFGLYLSGRLPWWAFAPVGVFVFIRFFDATHEEIHARDDGSVVWRALRLVFSVCGPLQLGYAELSKNHRQHHAYDGTSRDPDLWLMDGTLVSSLWHALTQPEQAALRYLRRNGLERRLVFTLWLNCAVYCGLAAVCSWRQFLVYNVVVRLGNGLSWWVFTHILHRPEIYRSLDRLAVPGWVEVAWVSLVGRNNFDSITFHFLHHAYGFVPTWQLPDLSEYLRDKTNQLRPHDPSAPGRLDALSIRDRRG